MAAEKKATKTEMKATEENLPMAMADMQQDADAGFEEASGGDFSIPFLRILQDLSPQCKERREEYVEGAKPGLFFNTVTQELSDVVSIVPCHFKKSMVEWVPRDSGGGFVAEHPMGTEEGLERDGGKFITKDGNDLIETAKHYVLIVSEDGDYMPAVVMLTSTQLKKSRRWMSDMQRLKMTGPNGRKFTPPMFSHLYRAKPKAEGNGQGDWYGWNFEIDRRLTGEDAEVYEAAKQFRDAVKAGQVREVDPDTEVASDNDDGM